MKGLEEVLSSAVSGIPIAFDTETDGRPVHGGALLRLVSVSDGTHTVVLTPEEHERTLRALLSRPYNWVAFNAKFDCAIVKHNLGVDMQDVTDVAILAHLVDSRKTYQGGVGQSLADLSMHYLGAAKEGDELKAEMRRGGWNWATIPIDNPVYLHYAAKDAALTAQLYGALQAYSLDPKTVALEHAVARACSDMEERGFMVDEEYTTDMGLKLRERARAGQVRALELGLKNVNSSQQICAVLGTPDARKETLQPMAEAGNELAAVVLDAKSAGKWAGTYTKAYLEAGGRVHASINPLGARTGRMSSSEPNLQNIPKGPMRGCLVADPGHVIWSVDFAGVEVRVLAAMSQDPDLIQMLLDGESLHDRTSAAMFGPDFTPEQRELGKRGVFATLYGAGYKKLMESLRVDEATARAIHGGLFKAFPGARRFDRAMRAQAEQRGFVQTASGRRMWVDKDQSYAATNYAVQGTAAELFKVALLQVVDAGLGGHLLVPVHDELVGQAPEGQVQAVLGAVQKAMYTELYGVPITTSGKVGRRSWGSLYEKGTS